MSTPVIQFNSAFNTAPSTDTTNIGPQIIVGSFHFAAPTGSNTRYQVTNGSGANTDFFIPATAFAAIPWQQVARGDYIIID